MGLSQCSVYTRRLSSPHPNSVANLVSDLFNILEEKGGRSTLHYVACIDTILLHGSSKVGVVPPKVSRMLFTCIPPLYHCQCMNMYKAVIVFSIQVHLVVPGELRPPST